MQHEHRKPKVTLPLKVGQKVIWNSGKGVTYPGYVALTGLRDRDQYSVLVVYGDEDTDDYVTRMRPDGTQEGLWGVSGAWLSDPHDPRDIAELTGDGLGGTGQRR